MTKVQQERRGRKIRSKMVALGITRLKVAIEVACDPSYVSHVIYGRVEANPGTLAGEIEQTLKRMGVPASFFRRPGAKKKEG